MKISKSKRQLAQLLIEAGVKKFHDGANWAAQDKSGMVWVYENIPKRMCEIWVNNGRGLRKLQTTIPNWHQTVLSRDEFDQIVAETAPDADGWIEWGGGECPVEKGVLVDVKFRDGTVQICCEAMLDKSPDHKYWTYVWSNSGGMYDIIAYRLHKTEQQLGELCDKVTEENKHEHVDAKPTIEQLAADYRNRKDYADRKQVEADAAKADAEAKLAELVAAGKSIDLVLSVAAQEPELVITDWRDLQGEDVIEVTSVHYKDNSPYEHVIGGLASVVNVGNPSHQMLKVREHSSGHLLLIDGFKFIRRP